MLRLAETRGVTPAEREYLPLCPALALVKPLAERPEDLFAVL